MLLIPAALCAVVDWWAVQTGRRAVELWAKPATMALLVVVAATAGDLGGGTRAWLVAGAVLGLAGDVALLDTGDTAFVAGLASFAAGHTAYVVAALTIGFDLAWAVPGIAVMVVLLSFRFLTRIVPGARAAGGPVLEVAVVLYGCIIGAMTVTAWATGSIVAGVGASLFAASDWVIGHRKFVAPMRWERLGVMVPYHVGQTLLIIGLATAR